MPNLGHGRVHDLLAARSLDEVPALGDVGLSRRHVPGLPGGEVEDRLLALVELDPRREAVTDRLDRPLPVT